jgi:hypothetical protein
VQATLSGDEGATSRADELFQVANCASLPFAPKMAIRLSGGVNRRGHPAIHAVVTAKPGDANLRGVTVILPKGELLDNAHIGTVCTRVEFAKHACPAASKLGEAKVTTPLLDEPLRGSIFLRSSQHKLPDLAFDLQGQFDIEAAGRVESVRSRLKTTFEALPDTPVSRIVVDLAGGRKGLLNNSEDLCGRPKRATVAMTGQNGVSRTSRPTLQVDCAPSSSRKRKG